MAEPVPEPERCAWAGSDPLYVAYHDQEWGVPVHDDRILFEFLILEGAQAGLSWSTILKKRANYRQAFDNFEIQLVRMYGEEKVAELLSNPGIVRNKLKVRSAISNAQAAFQIQQEFGSLDTYLWGFVGGKPVHNAWRHLSEIPAQTETARQMSKELSRLGFRFIGPTICYAFMQAVGMVNDHMVSCFRYKELLESA